VAVKYAKMRWRPGLHPRPRWGSSRRSPDPQVGWEGNTPSPDPTSSTSIGTTLVGPPPCIIQTRRSEYFPLLLGKVINPKPNVIYSVPSLIPYYLRSKFTYICVLDIRPAPTLVGRACGIHWRSPRHILAVPGLPRIPEMPAV